MNAVRKASPPDFEAVRNLLIESGLVDSGLTPAHLEGFVVIPAQSGASSLVGVAGVETFPDSKDGLLRSVAVVPALRGQGLGLSLVAAAEKRAVVLGQHRLWLLTTTAPDFFRRLGYVDAGRAQAPAAVRQSGEFQSLCPASAVCLSKAL